MPLTLDVDENSFKIKGRVPDKVLWVILAAIMAAFGLEYQEIMNFVI